MKSSSAPTTRPSTPRWVWIGLPLALAVAPAATRAVSEEAYQRWFRSESSLVEVGTALFLLAAIVLGYGVARRGQLLPARWLGVWFGTFVVGCVYFAGEEISWGQHLFGWSTPDSLAEANDQSETNLHNLGGWAGGLLDQLPRTLLTLAALVGGILGPWWLRARRRTWDPARDVQPWVWPDGTAWPAALGALVVTLPRKLLDEDLPVWLDVQAGESKEAFLALFLLVYIAGVRAQVWRVEGAATVRGA